MQIEQKIADSRPKVRPIFHIDTQLMKGLHKQLLGSHLLKVLLWSYIRGPELFVK